MEEKRGVLSHFSWIIRFVIFIVVFIVIIALVVRWARSRGDDGQPTGQQTQQQTAQKPANNDASSDANKEDNVEIKDEATESSTDDEVIPSGIDDTPQKGGSVTPVEVPETGPGIDLLLTTGFISAAVFLSLLNRQYAAELKKY